MAFPSSPTNGQTAVVNGITYTYSTTTTAWTRVTGGNISSLSVSGPTTLWGNLTSTGNITAGNVLANLYGTQFGNTVGTTATYSGAVATGNLTTGGYVTHNIALGTLSAGVLTIAGNVYGKSGSPGYLDAITLTNSYSGATNPNKWIRLDSSGNFQIINSAFSATVLQVSDSGLISTGGVSSVSSGIPTSNGIAMNSNGYIFDDGNFHIHTSSGQLWINTMDSSLVAIGEQYTTGSGASLAVQQSITAINGNINATNGNINVQGGVTTSTTNPASHSFFPKVQSNWNVNQPSLAMDNLNVRLNNSSGNNLLIQASAVSGSFTAYITTFENISGQTLTGQTNSGGITFTAGTWTSINAVHTLSSGGDVIFFFVMDTTTGKIYRVTTMHTNGSTNGSIFIERMV
jgi:hypothetical protein